MQKTIQSNPLLESCDVSALCKVLIANGKSDGLFRYGTDEYKDICNLRNIRNNYSHPEGILELPSETMDKIFDDVELVYRRFDWGLTNVKAIRQDTMTQEELKKLLTLWEDDCKKEAEEVKKRFKDEQRDVLKNLPIYVLNKDKEFELVERKRAKYTAQLSLLPTEVVNEHIADQLSEFHKRCADAKSMEYKDLITESERTCFIRGVAGIGKTTLAEWMTLMWARGDVFNDMFDFLLLVKCRELDSQKKSIKQYIKEELGVDPRHLSCGNRVLVIIDGIDEVPDLATILDNTDSKLHAILKKGKPFLQGHATIITGRPHIESTLKRYEKDLTGQLRIVEIIGLQKEDIVKHIEIFCNNDGESAANIQTKIKNSPAMAKLATVPQYLNTLCCVLSMNGEDVKVERMTTLYVWTLVSFWRQHADWKLREAYEIFKDPNVSKFFVDLAEISYNLLLENKIIFEEDKLPEAIKTAMKNKESEDKKEKEESKKMQEMFKIFIVEKKNSFGIKYQFRHLTMHEFFAAAHCWIKSIKVTELLGKQWYEVVRFYGGFFGAEDCGDKDERRIVRMFMECLKMNQSAEIQNQNLMRKTDFFGEVLTNIIDELEINFVLDLFQEMFDEVGEDGEVFHSNRALQASLQVYFSHTRLIRFYKSISPSDLRLFRIATKNAEGDDSLKNNIIIFKDFIFTAGTDKDTLFEDVLKILPFFRKVEFSNCEFQACPWRIEASWPKKADLLKSININFTDCKVTGDDYTLLEELKSRVTLSCRFLR